MVIAAFLPSALRIRAGDTVIWKQNGDEIHTVTFFEGPQPPAFLVPVPGGTPVDFMINPQVAFPTRPPGAPVETYGGTGYINSGVLSNQPAAPGAPPNDAISVTFNRPGTYSFLCMFHPFMRGTVEVVPATTRDVPAQADIDAQGQAQLGPLMALSQAAMERGKTALSQPGSGGATLWMARAGYALGDPAAEVYDFFPKDLTIKAGDTVIWSSPGFHTVTFNPAPPPPEFIVPKPQPQGPPLITLNPQVLIPAKPTGVFDPAKYFNSAPFGVDDPAAPPTAMSWALTFDKPGTFKYFCAVHRELGMEGSIIVQPR